MSILDSLLSAGDGGVVKQLAGQFGVNSEQATSVVSTLLPALAGGLKEKLAHGDTSGLSNLISGGSLTKFADNPSSLATPEALEQGKSLVSKIFGSEDLTSVVSKVAEKADISSNVVSSILPVAGNTPGRPVVEEHELRRQSIRSDRSGCQRRAQRRRRRGQGFGREMFG